MKSVYENLVISYADLIDARNFKGLKEILWDDFSMTGAFELNGAEAFITSLDQLHNFESTMHRVSNIQFHAENQDKLTGSCYCIASHISHHEHGKFILDMGIIYRDTLETRNGQTKIIERNFSMVWQETRNL